MSQSLNDNDHWGKRTDRFLVSKLENARQILRIATGFFTVQGYDCVRPALTGNAVHILVGFDETSRERLREKLIDDIMLYLSFWDAENRREAVQTLVQQLKQGQLQIVEKGEKLEFIDARIRSQDHAKVYIVDESAALVGSPNLTRSGLRSNSEGITAVHDPQQVQYWVSQFECYWNAPDTHDLTEELLAELLRWLDLAMPYDIYLKTIHALVPKDETEAPRDSYKAPTRFQQVVIERTLRQLRRHRGAMVVASTGLGKTIMGTHTALRLKNEGRILNVVVFAPKAVKENWEQELFNAGLSHRVFTRDLLDYPNTGEAVSRIVATLTNQVDTQHLIIIDESHHFRNRIRGEGDDMRRSFKRLETIIERAEPFVLLLTATPYAKGVRDLNNQLRLLPHTAEPNMARDDGQIVMPALVDLRRDFSPRAWYVRGSDDFFDEFVNLPVCTVISTSQVAKNFAQETDNGEYVDFGDTRMWLPQIEVRKVTTPVPLEREISDALDRDFFTHDLQTFRTRGIWRHSEDTIVNKVNIAWASSPAALRRTLKASIDGTYDVDFKASLELRRRRLAPLVDRLAAMSFEDDPKLMALTHLIRSRRGDGQKVLVFTELRETALYLERGIAKLVPEARIANVVEQADGGVKLKSPSERRKLARQFAPIANADARQPEDKDHTYDVFVSTDVFGEGVNLQDASVAVSYDLAWTPDKIIQRAGRILRFWHEPRTVSLYVFVGKFEKNSERRRKSQRLEERLQRLTTRTKEAEQFSEIPILPEGDHATYKSLGQLSSVTVEDLGLLDIAEAEEFPGFSNFLVHLTELRENEELAASIDDDISSAVAYDGDRHLLYLLLRYEGEYEYVVFDIDQRHFRELQDSALLNLIQCTKETPIADVSATKIETLAQRCKNAWCRQNDIDSLTERVERVCALYLLPRAEAGTTSMLSEL